MFLNANSIVLMNFGIADDDFDAMDSSVDNGVRHSNRLFMNIKMVVMVV
jgi:hypothetical protein